VRGSNVRRDDPRQLCQRWARAYDVVIKCTTSVTTTATLTLGADMVSWGAIACGTPDCSDVTPPALPAGSLTSDTIGVSCAGIVRGFAIGNGVVSGTSTSIDCPFTLSKGAIVVLTAATPPGLTFLGGPARAQEQTPPAQSRSPATPRSAPHGSRPLQHVCDRYHVLPARTQATATSALAQH
jgi:hypothetical protein